MTFFSTKLSIDHRFSSFDCGIDSMNEWLRTNALRAQTQSTARTYVWTDGDAPDVVAYFSIAPTLVSRDELTRGQSGGISTVPAFLLARLALDRQLHGQGLGGDLLANALEVIIAASHASAGRLIIVDAVDDNAAAFYRHYDFQPVKGRRDRLVMKVATARNALGVMTASAEGDPSTGLVSTVFTMPDGKTVPIVASIDEMEAIGHRMLKLATEARGEEPPGVVDLSRVFAEVLGRNPFASE